MNTNLKIVLGTLLLLGFAAGGYWFGTHAGASVKETPSSAGAERKVLYYRNPMGLPDTSPVPKKDAMGMDYVPVFDGDAGLDSGHAISVSIDKVQKLGVKSEAVVRRELKRTLHATGRIEIDESRSYTIAPRFEGWVERLYVNTSGQAVSKGQPLFDVYSPELVSAQHEHALALQGLAALKDADDDAQKSMRRLADASAARLKNWNMGDAPVTALPSPHSSDGTTSQSTKSANGQVAAYPASGESEAWRAKPGEREEQSSIPARPRVTFRAPASGIVIEKKAVQGMRFMPGEVLYQIADLSSVWVIAEVAEQDIGQIKLGSIAQVKVDAYPERSFDAHIDFIYPTLNSATRTVQVRMGVANPKGLLKPSMFTNAQIFVDKGDKVLAVPASAVIDSGTRQIVLVRLAEGRFEPRTVRLGMRSNDYIEVIDGVTEGEQVVTSANFLIDAESNLKAALGGLTETAAHGSTPDASRKQVADATADHSAHGTGAQPQQNAKAVGHQALGILESVNPDGTVSITHEPIRSLGWPGMTMDFTLTNSSLVAGIRPGSRITFEIVERKPDEWVITKLQIRHEGH